MASGLASLSDLSLAILVVDSDVISRHAIADHLRTCGYFVIEAIDSDEAMVALKERTLPIDIVLFAVIGLDSKPGFDLANWARTNRPEVQVKLAGGVAMASQAAAELCENGPHLKRPYEPEAVVDYIQKLRATRPL